MRRWLQLILALIFSVGLSGCTLWSGPSKAGLQVITNDIPSSLFLDGQYLDKTPLINKDLKPGTYTLKIQPEDSSLASYETTVTLHKGLLSVVTWKPGIRPELSGGVMYEMEKLPNKKATQLALISIPDGAIVSLDGEQKDFAPLVIDNIKPGSHEFTVSLPSYETQQHTLNMVEGHKINITVKLARAAGASDQPLNTIVATESASLSASTAGGLNASTSAKASPSPKTSTSSAQLTGSRVLIKKTNFYQDEVEVLRVRSSANSGASTLGFAPVGTEYPYLNKQLDGWYNITFEGKSGWVSSQFTELLGTN